MSIVPSTDPYQHFRTNDPHFVRDLLESDKHVRRVADRLRAALGSGGPRVQVQELKIRPDESKMSEYSDDGDLRVGDQRVECKRRNLQFTGPSDFPYPTCIVDVCHTFDAARNTQTPILAYIIDSQDESGCVGVLTSTFDRWRAHTRHDRAKQRDRRFYEVAKELLCTFDELVTVLNGGKAPFIPEPVCFFEQFRD